MPQGGQEDQESREDPRAPGIQRAHCNPRHLAWRWLLLTEEGRLYCHLRSGSHCRYALEGAVPVSYPKIFGHSCEKLSGIILFARLHEGIVHARKLTHAIIVGDYMVYAR